MSSYFNREDRLDREFSYLREQRERESKKKEKENELERQIEILKTENKELKEKLNNCSHFKSQLKWYENFFEEALMKYMHDSDYFNRKKEEPFPSITKHHYYEDNSDEEDLIEENKQLKSKNSNYMKEWRKKHPNYHRDYNRRKKSNIKNKDDI